MGDPVTTVEADAATVVADTKGVIATVKAFAVKYGITVAGVIVGFILGKIL